MKKFFVTVFTIMGVLSYAQTEELTLEKAIRYALENKADAQKAQLAIERSNYQIQEVRASALPKIDINAGLTYNIELQSIYINGSSFGQNGVVRMQMGQKWNSQATAQLTQVLFNQTVFIGLKAARTTREFYQLNLELTETQIIEKVATIYYHVFQSKQTLENIEQNLSLTEKTAAIINGLYDSGLAKKIDLDRTIVAVNNLKSARQQALNGLQLTENTLKFMIGMPIEEQITLPKDGFEPDFRLVFEDDNIQERIEIRTLEKQHSLLELNIKAQQSNYYPSLALVGSYGWLGMGPKNPLFYGEKNDVYWSDFSSVGINLNIPIFAGFGTKAKVNMARVDLKSLEADIKDTKLAMNLALENAKNQLQNSLLTIENQNNNVKLAQNVLLNTQNNYAQGLATLTDLLDAERALADSKNNYTNAVLNYKLAEIELLKAKGTLKQNLLPLN
ncbi:MAG: TolC family protein [Bacteroidota bacterium]|nr:TolC family protein [Bacteroidota bacterium]